MKAILVPVDQSSSIASVLTCAELLARRLDGIAEGVALRPDPVSAIAPEPVIAETILAMRNDDEFIGRVKVTFESHFGSFPELRHRWRGGSPVDESDLGSLSRVYDLTVLSRPSDSANRRAMTTLETALFESGRPILVAPPSAPKSIGENIVISWNCSTEQASAMGSAMPLLRLAKTVTILTIEGLTVAGPTGAQAKECLAASGIDACEITMGNGGKKPGAVLLAEAQKLGADLIVKGAYTQSRFRQMIFGGATSHLLAHSSLPILMAR